MTCFIWLNWLWNQWKRRLRPIPTELPKWELCAEPTWITVVRVKDGDTFVCAYNDSKRGWTQFNIRLAGVDTPELHPTTGTVDERIVERALAEQAKLFTTEWFRVENYQVRMKTHGLDKYGRFLGEIWNHRGESLGMRLIELGYGKMYDGGTKKGLWNQK